MDTIRYQETISRKFKRRLLFAYILIKGRWILLILALFTAFCDAFIICGIGFPFVYALPATFVFTLIAFCVITYVVVLFRERRDCLFCDSAENLIDFENGIFQCSSELYFYKFAISRITSIDILKNYIFVERGIGSLFLLRTDAFPTRESFQEFVKQAREAVVRNKNPRVQVIPAQVREKKCSIWKNCLIGCGVLALLALVFGGVFLWQTYKTICGLPEVRKVRLTAGERTELEKAFVRLDDALRKQAPALHAKRKLIPSGDLSALRTVLQGKVIEPLEMWFSYFYGMEDCEIVPSGVVMGASWASSTYLAVNRGLAKLVVTNRHGAFPLLMGYGENDCFYSLNSVPMFVFYNRSGTVGGGSETCSMAEFVNRIAEAVELGWVAAPHMP